MGTVGELKKTADQEDADAVLFIARVWDVLPPNGQHVRYIEIASEINANARRVLRVLRENPMYFEETGTAQSRTNPLKFGRSLTMPVLATTDAFGRLRHDDERRMKE